MRTLLDKEMTYAVVPRQTGDLSSSYTRVEQDQKFNEANKKLSEAIMKIEKIDYTMFAVVVILLVMVATLVIDSFHVNSVIYKEYSQKTESAEITQKINQELLGQNKQNQELILKQQNQIIELLNKK